MSLPCKPFQDLQLEQGGEAAADLSATIRETRILVAAGGIGGGQIPDQSDLGEESWKVAEGIEGGGAYAPEEVGCGGRI